MTARSWRPDRLTLIDAAAASLCTILAVEAFATSYGGIRFLIVGGVASLLALVVGHVIRVLRAPAIVGAVGAVVVYLVVGGVVAVPEFAIAGFLPSVDTVRAAAETAVQGWRELLTTAPPVAGIGTLMVLPFVAGYFGTLSTFLLMRHSSGRPRSAVPSLLPVGVVLAIAILMGIREPASLILQGPVLAGVALAWLAVRSDARHQRLPGAPSVWQRSIRGVGMLTVAGLVGWFLSPSLPFASADDRVVWRTIITPPFDPRVHPSPLSGYRSYLAEQVERDEELFTIEGLPTGTLVRLATLDTYDGLVWRPGFDDEDPGEFDSGFFSRVGSKIEPDIDGETTTVTVTITGYTGIWVPDVGEVVSLEFDGGPRDRELNESFRYNRVTDTAVTELGLRAGDRYVMTVVLPPAPSAMAGRAIDFEREVPEPAAVENVSAWTEKLPGLLEIDDPGTRLDSMQTFMRETGTYTDGDQSRGQVAARAGHSAVRLAQFVDATRGLAGNAEQYASTFALVAQSRLGIPARVVMGFRTDDQSGDILRVTGDDVEAWVEVPVTGVGWMPMFPTPDRTDIALKQQSQTPPQPDYDTQSPEPPPLVDPEFDTPATSKSDLADQEDNEDNDDTNNDSSFTISGWAVVAVAVVMSPVLLFVLLLGAVLGIKAIRRRRRYRRGRPDERIANGWREMLDAGIDMGRPVPPTGTRREAATTLGPTTMALAQRADVAIFGGDQLSDDDVDAYWSDLELTLSELKRELPLVDRLRAALSLATLRRGHRAPSPSTTPRTGSRRR